MQKFCGSRSGPGVCRKAPHGNGSGPPRTGCKYTKIPRIRLLKAVPAGNLFLRGNEVFVFVDLFKKFRPPVVVPDGLGAIFVHKVRVLFDVAKLEAVCIEQVGGQPRRVVKGFFEVAVLVDAEFHADAAEIAAVARAPVPRMPGDFIVRDVVINLAW